jgi:hypothetical protein
MNGVFFSPDRIPVHFVLFAGWMMCQN